MITKQQKKIGIVATIAVLLLTIVSGAMYTTKEGTVDIIYRTGKAISYTEPGLNFKIPLIDVKDPMEVRVRKNQETFQVMTSGSNSDSGEAEVQTPSQLTVAAIWSIPRTEVLKMVQVYGSLEQFETRVLDNKLLNAAKEKTSKRSIEEIVLDRNSLKQDILQRFKELTAEYVVNIHDVEIVDFTPNEKYINAVNDKLISKQAAEKESDELEKNALIEQRKENAADSKANALRTTTAADAQRIRDLGDAEAYAIEVVQKQLSKSDKFIDYTIAKGWDGAQPTTMVTGADQGMLLNIQAK